MAFWVARVERAEGRSGRAGASVVDVGVVVDGTVDDCDATVDCRGADVFAALAPARSQGFGGEGDAIVSDVVCV